MTYLECIHVVPNDLLDEVQNEFDLDENKMVVHEVNMSPLLLLRLKMNNLPRTSINCLNFSLSLAQRRNQNNGIIFHFIGISKTYIHRLILDQASSPPITNVSCGILNYCTTCLFPSMRERMGREKSRR
jgi:hypothetical protein